MTIPQFENFMRAPDSKGWPKAPPRLAEAKAEIDRKDRKEAGDAMEKALRQAGKLK